MKCVTSIKDLGVLFNSKLDFSDHIEVITKKSFRALGFIYRSSKDFTNMSTISRLVSAFVRPVLEYCSVIWSPHVEIHINKLERVQRKCCKFVIYWNPERRPNLKIEDVYKQLNFNTLSSRRKVADLVCFFKILNGISDCPELLNEFHFICARSGLRVGRLVDNDSTNKNYVLHGPKNRIAALVNTYFMDLEFFDSSVDKFKENAKRLILN